MQKTIISTINPNFQPSIIPKVRGRLALEKLQPEAFPMYVAPVKEGIDLLIRGGHIFLTTFPYVVLNTQIRERFKVLLETSRKRNFTLHATLISPNVPNKTLYTILTKPTSLLPNGSKLYITMCLYEKSILEMEFKNIISLVKAFFGTKENPLMQHVLPATYIKVKSKEELKDIVEFTLANVKDSTSVLLLNEKGSYIQGDAKLTETNAVIVDPTEEVYGTIIGIGKSTSFLPGETLETADNLLIKFGETRLEYSLVNSPLSLRGFLLDIKNNLIGSKVLCKNLYIAGRSTPSILKVEKIYYI